MKVFINPQQSKWSQIYLLVIKVLLVQEKKSKISAATHFFIRPHISLQENALRINNLYDILQYIRTYVFWMVWKVFLDWGKPDGVCQEVVNHNKIPISACIDKKESIQALFPRFQLFVSDFLSALEKSVLLILYQWPQYPHPVSQLENEPSNNKN